MRVLLLALLATTGCVDGKTPDCSSVDSGCFPEDAATGATDAGDASDSNAPTDAATDATDAPTTATDAAND